MRVAILASDLITTLLLLARGSIRTTIRAQGAVVAEVILLGQELIILGYKGLGLMILTGVTCDRKLMELLARVVYIMGHILGHNVRKFLNQVLPFLVEVLVQDGIYLVRDFPNHPKRIDITAAKPLDESNVTPVVNEHT
jgi:hypothetical protein